MRVLLDTNVLMRSVNDDDPNKSVADAAIQRLRDDGAKVYLVPQTVHELWTALTRTKKANGLGFTPDEAYAAIDAFLATFTVLPDPDDLHVQWLRLMRDHQVSGTNAYDGRLAAAMEAHGLTHVLTFNAKDFGRYPHITIVDPVVEQGG